ncbi:MAG: PAS domain S-box protein, partial [Usitatibacteraceae bacterium]
MNRTLRLLLVDDSEDDATLLVHELRRDGYDVEFERVDTAPDMRAALQARAWDIITSDHSMPQFGAPAALALATQLCPDTPFIIVSGEINLNLAVSLMKAGADDYVQKRELPRLIPAIARALRDAAMRIERTDAKTALTQSELRYRRLFETAQDGILILDATTGQIIDVNPFLIDLLGYSREETLGKELWEIGAFRDASESKNTFRELQTKGYVRYEDLPLKTSTGALISVEFISNTYYVDNKKVAQCNIRDVTEHKRYAAEICRLNVELEEKVLARTAQLEALNSELDAFSASVSHDLRAPLHRILGFTEILCEDHPQTQSAESLQLIAKIRVSVERMTAIIDALLALAHFSRSEVVRASVNLSEAVGRIATELQQSQPDRHVDFVTAHDISANGDAPLLSIVLENLLSNAWKFTGKTAAPRIEFGSATEADGSTAYFVRDNGAGFDMAYAD